MAKDKNVNSPAPAAAAKPSAGLGVAALAAIVVSSMVGGGIYSLPQNMAAGASAGAVLLAWLITGIGVYFIANTFRILSEVRPDLTAGIYMYSREGFGSYAGFCIGWSYWLCQICGNVGYAVITMDALNYFFPPYFAGGNNLLSVVLGSLLIWGFNVLVLRGIKQATIINFIGTVGKIVPLLLFILILLFVFKSSQFSFDFWGENLATKAKLGSLSTQIKSTMLVTLWAFIGIEGAVVMSKHAKSPQDVGKATLLGFLGCLVIYILLSLLPFGYMSQSELAAKFLLESCSVMSSRYQSAPNQKSQIVGSSIYAFYAQNTISKDEPSNLKRFYTPTEDGAFRVYCDEHAKYTDITVEHYSSIVATSSLGVRKLSVKKGA